MEIEKLLEKYEFEGKFKLEHQHVARKCLGQFCNAIEYVYSNKTHSLLSDLRKIIEGSSCLDDVVKVRANTRKLHDLLDESFIKEKLALRAIICALSEFKNELDVFDAFFQSIDYCTRASNYDFRKEAEKILIEAYELPRVCK